LKENAVHAHHQKDASQKTAIKIQGDKMKKVNASHILVKIEENAKVVLYDVKHGKKFEDVAKSISICPSGKRGGNLGWFGKGQMVKEFETACFSGKKGDIVGPVKTQFGYHIIRIDDTE
jgi:peptidyl-prolyl cis-trans isomerase C